MRRWLLLGTACVALCAPASATADAAYPLVLDTNRTLQEAPAVTARGAVFVEGRHFALFGRDGRRHPLRRLDALAPRDREDLTTALDASGRRVALQVTRYACEDESGVEVEPCFRLWSKLYATALGGRPKLVERCGDAYSEDTGGEQDIALVGPTLAYVACAHKGRTPIKIRSLKSPDAAPRVIDPPQPNVRFVAVSMAGRFVAGLAEGPPDDDQPNMAQAGTAIVYDAATGAEVYRASVRAWSIDVDSSGRLLVPRDDPAVTPPRPDCDGFSLEWYSPDQRYAHPMADHPCTPEARLAGARAVFWRVDGDGRVTLVAVGLATGESRAVSSSLDYPSAGFDVAGQRVAYGAPACIYDQLVVDDIEDVRDPSHVPAPRCPMRVGRQGIRVAQDGVVRVPIRCPNGCSGDYEIESHGSEDLYDGGSFVAQPGKLRWINTSVPRRRHKPRLLDLSLSPYQPDGADRDVKRVIRIPPSKSWRSGPLR
jgi:hypothetical protein